MTLFWQHFRAQSRGFLVWLLVSSSLFFLQGSAAPAVINDDAFLKTVQMMPEGMRALMGYIKGLSAADAYLATKMGGVSNLILVLYAVMLALVAVTREVDRRTIDFLLSQPVSRFQVLAARTGVMAFNVSLLAGAIWAVTRAGFAATGVVASWDRFALMIASQLVLALAAGALTLLASMWVDDYSVGVKVSLGLVVGLYMVEYGLRAALLSRAARIWSPFSYADGASVMQYGLNWPELAGMVLVGAAAVALSFRAFEQKQITA